MSKEVGAGGRFDIFWTLGGVGVNPENLPFRRASTVVHKVLLLGNLLDPGPLVNYCN